MGLGSSFAIILEVFFGCNVVQAFGLNLAFEVLDKLSVLDWDIFFLSGLIIKIRLKILSRLKREMYLLKANWYLDQLWSNWSSRIGHPIELVDNLSVVEFFLVETFDEHLDQVVHVVQSELGLCRSQARAKVDSQGLLGHFASPINILLP